MGLRADMMYPSKSAAVEYSCRFTERGNKSVVIADLSHQPRRLRQFDQLLAVRMFKHEGLFAENVKLCSNRLSNQICMGLGGRRDENGIERFFAKHLVEVVVALQPRIAFEDAREISEAVTCCDEIDIRVGSQDRQMRESHLAEPNNRDTNHM